MDGVKRNYRARSRLEVFYTGGCVRLSSDGTTLACACADEAKLVDVETGSIIRTFNGDTEPVTALTLSIDSRHLFVASRSLQLRCFSVEIGQQIRSFKGHRAPIADMAVDSTGALLATASADRSARVWDIDGGYCTHNFTGHSGVVLCCIFHPTQLLLATGGDDSQVRVWDLVSKTCVATLQAHFSAVTSLSISPDGWTLLSGGRDGVVIAWSLRDYKKIATIPVYEALEGVVAVPSALCNAPASVVCFATGGEKGITKLWRIDTGKCVFDTAPVEAGLPTTAGGIVELRAVPPGKNNPRGGLLAATQDCRLLFLKSSDKTAAGPASASAGGDSLISFDRQLIGNNDEVTDLRFLSPSTVSSSSSPSHIAVASNAEHIRVFDVASLSCQATLAGHTEAVLCLDTFRLKSGKTLLASGSKDNTVRVWLPLENENSTTQSGGEKCLAVGTGHVGAVSAVAFARRSGNFIVTGGSDKLLKVWDTSSLSLDGDGKSGEKRKVASLQAVAAVAAHMKDINAVAVAPNDSVVASASQDRTVKIWQLPSLVPVLTLKGHKRGVWSVAFSPVDKAVATASGDKTIKVWSLADGACLRTFEGHVASVLRVDFLSSGTQLLSAGGDGLLKLWNLRTTECVNTFDAHDDKVWALTLGGNSGEIAASGGADGGLVIWEDCTALDAEDAAKDQEVTLLHEQQLSNAMHSKNWKKAAGLAFEMKHPGRLLAVIRSAYQGGQEAGDGILRTVVADLDSEKLRQCLEYCREWNTNGRTCFAAQAILGAVLRQHSPAELVAIPAVAPLLEAIEAYTRRHFARTDRLLRSTFVVDYVLGAMNVLTPANDVDVLNGGAGLLSDGKSLKVGGNEKGSVTAMENGHATEAGHGGDDIDDFDLDNFSSEDEDEDEGAHGDDVGNVADIEEEEEIGVEEEEKEETEDEIVTRRAPKTRKITAAIVEKASKGKR
ncbi:putative Transducin beta-like protein 3 [Nannochloris sp. 'desiccata']|nr:putative Transducin beta-like protein 3 [Chlorella desiccata (nom. nud.)]